MQVRGSSNRADEPVRPTAGIVGGALLGGLIGGAVGNRMDAADRREAYHATQYSLEKNPLGVGKSKAKEVSMPQ
jgi:surface antigen